MALWYIDMRRGMKSQDLPVVCELSSQLVLYFVINFEVV